MLYKNTRVLSKEFVFERKDVCVVDGAIKESAGNEEQIDGSEYYIVPALTDIHTHGAQSVCANDATTEAYGILDKYMKTNGIYGFLPTLITDDADKMVDICKKYAEYKKHIESPSAGLYLEGPFINTVKKGAHNEKYIINPDIELFKRMFDAGEGLVKVITVAPELPGAIAFIQEASKMCRVALGHTAADYETALRAFDAGATDVTHLFNAMNPMGHRSPGIIAAARDRGAYVELICDGIHVHPSVIRMVFSAFDKDKIVFISDSISATGLPDGSYTLGGLKTIVENNVSRLEDGTLAGSTTNLLGCVRKAVEFGIGLEDAVRAASQNPCDLIRRQNDKVIVLDKALNLVG